MADWSEISAPYSDAIVRVFPIHRAVVFIFGLSASLSVEKSRESIVSEFFDFRFLEALPISTGFFKESTGLNLLLGLIAVISGVLLSGAINRCIFIIINKATSIKQRTQKISREWANNLSIEDRKIALEVIDSATSETKTRIRAMAGFNELVTGFFLITFTASIFTGFFDGVTSLILFLTALISHAIALHVFINDYYGFAATKAQLLGKSMPEITIK